ncbi:MAG TPA: TRAP transporter substrate-binding protein [Reyranella sp.]|nr:TRAP transporter substrate-binding protein [Reyranella sp.]
MELQRRTALKAGLGALVAPAVAHAQTPPKLALTTTWPDGHLHTVNLRRFADEARQATGGAFDIDVKSGGHLGFTGPEQLRAVRDGLVAMADSMNIQQAGDEPMLGVEALPFLCASLDELKVLLNHVRPEYDKVAQRNNQTILYVAPWPAQYLHLKLKAETADGLRAIKIRMPDRIGQEIAAAIGMAPVSMPWADTLPALESGAVSGVATSTMSAVDGKLWERLKFFHATSHSWASQIVTINNDSWKKIAPANQKIVAELASRLEPEFWSASAQVDRDGSTRLIAGGMQRVETPPAMMADLRKRTAPMIAGYMDRVPESAAPLAAYLAEMKRG